MQSTSSLFGWRAQYCSTHSNFPLPFFLAVSSFHNALPLFFTTMVATFLYTHHHHSQYFIVMFKVNRDRFMLYNLFEIRFQWHTHTASRSMDKLSDGKILSLLIYDFLRKREEMWEMKKKPQGLNGCHTKFS